MSVRKVLLITLIFLLTLTFFRLIWLELFTTPNQPQAIHGVIDLRNWNPMSDDSVTLTGEWEFFPNTLLYPEQPTDLPIEHKSESIQVPDSWSLPGEHNRKYGFGTYRLRILVDPLRNETLAVHIRQIVSSSEVFLNGELLDHSGKPGTTKQDYEPSNLPYTLYFSSNEMDEIELVIQVANFDNPFNGGIITPPKFGIAERINRDHKISFVIVMFASAIYFVNALYSFIIYFMGWRVKRDHRLLYFSFIIILVIFATLMTEHIIFIKPFEWSFKSINLGLIAGGYLLMQLIKPQLPNSKWFRYYVMLAGILGILTLLLPLPLMIPLTHIASFVTLIPCILAIIAIYQWIANMDKDKIFLYLGAVAAVYSFVWLMIIEIRKIEFTSYPVDLLIATICFAIYFFKQYFQSLTKTEQMMSELKEMDKNKDNFLVSVAHEMKNPLHGILNISQTVMEREKGTLKEQSRHDLKLILTVGRRMSAILNDLLELEKFKEKRITVKIQDVSVHSVAESVVDMLRYMADGKRISLVNRIPVDFPSVLADENRLNQILFNLIHNAVKFSHNGEVSVAAAIRERWAEISVSDTGVGIEDDFLNHIFDPYKQNSSMGSLHESGIGLGLSICKQLVELQGGELKVSSKLHEGSVFTFTLKLSPLAQQTDQVKSIFLEEVEEQISVATEMRDANILSIQQNDTRHHEMIRILAVDDDPVNLKVLKSIFSISPYEIYTASDGEEALAMLEKGKWDLVITDVMMPHISGYELTTLIREKYSILELPILLLTAYNREEGVEAGFRVGANDYVSKPMNAMELVSRVESLINLKRSVNERMRMEAAWLQAQIKPHFIINTFNSIAALGRIDLDRMDDLIEELSKYIRLSIDFQNSDGLAPLHRELELVRSYLFIQQKRFSDRLHVIWEMDDHIQINIPPLTIQPLVENAISHGILKRISGGVIRIVLKDQGEFISVSIKDNGVGMSKETVEGLLDLRSNQQMGIGLLNTDRRLKQFYGKGLIVDSKLGEGTTVSFRIPKKGK